METDIFSSKMEVMPSGTPSSFSIDNAVQQEPPMHLHRPSSDRAQVCYIYLLSYEFSQNYWCKFLVSSRSHSEQFFL